MAKECLNNCPRIEGARRADAYRYATPIPGGFLFIPNANIFQSADAALEDARSCEGPIEEVIDVTRGIIHKRVVQEKVWRCRLDQQPATATPSKPTETKA
jgi:hypothetical protein